jgi:hypothetical protein
MHKGHLDVLRIIKRGQLRRDDDPNVWTTPDAQAAFRERVVGNPDWPSSLGRILTVIDDDGTPYLGVIVHPRLMRKSTTKVLSYTWSQFISGDFPPAALSHEVLATWLRLSVETVRKRTRPKKSDK